MDEGLSVELTNEELYTIPDADCELPLISEMPEEFSEDEIEIDMEMPSDDTLADEFPEDEMDIDEELLPSDELPDEFSEDELHADGEIPPDDERIDEFPEDVSDMGREINVEGSLTEEQYHDLVDDLPKEALEYLRDGLENRDKDVLDYFGFRPGSDSSDHPKEFVLKKR